MLWECDWWSYFYSQGFSLVGKRRAAQWLLTDKLMRYQIKGHWTGHQTDCGSKGLWPGARCPAGSLSVVGSSMGSVLGLMLPNIFINGQVSTFWKVLYPGRKWFSAILFEKNHWKKKRKEKNEKRGRDWTGDESFGRRKLWPKKSSSYSSKVLTKFPTLLRFKISYHYYTIWINFLVKSWKYHTCLNFHF